VYWTDKELCSVFLVTAGSMESRKRNEQTRICVITLKRVLGTGAVKPGLFPLLTL
jgi:hypothetical protein